MPLEYRVTNPIPQSVRDECPLPEGAYWREETSGRWAGICFSNGTSVVISANDMDGYRITERYSGRMVPSPPMTFEQACRFAWAYVMTGQDSLEQQ